MEEFILIRLKTAQRASGQAVAGNQAFGKSIT
jgi:hypothetical protein